MDCEHRNWEIGLTDDGREEASCKVCSLTTMELRERIKALEKRLYTSIPDKYLKRLDKWMAGQ